VKSLDRLSSKGSFFFFFIFSFLLPKEPRGRRHGGRQAEETVRFDAVHDDFDEFYLYGGCGRVAQVTVVCALIFKQFGVDDV
jgi:hypothetical protein